jgi:uncharacterized membrane protein
MVGQDAGGYIARGVWFIQPGRRPRRSPLFGIHHVNETVPQPQWIFWDIGFLIWGAAMLVGGWLLLRGGKRKTIRASSAER